MADAGIALADDLHAGRPQLCFKRVAVSRAHQSVFIRGGEKCRGIAGASKTDWLGRGRIGHAGEGGALDAAGEGQEVIRAGEADQPAQACRSLPSQRGSSASIAAL